MVVRHRPDLFFHRLEWPRAIGYNDVFVPYWGSYGGINDRFAIMGIGGAEYYFSAYDHAASFLREGCPLHPETLSAAALAVLFASVRPTLLAEFTGVRLPDAAGHCETVPMVVTEHDHFRHRAALAAGR